MVEDAPTPETDAILLARFVDDRSDSAFRALVARYVNFVFASALRQTRNRADAEDVTQAVFLILFRKARTLRQAKTTTIAAWLARVTHFAAVDSLRRRVRRARHERTAAAEHASVASDAHSDSSDLADNISPVLDRALASLSEKDRNALIHRFHLGASFTHVGQTLGITEEAARKRVGRAIDKLRARLQRLGVTATPAVVVAALAPINTSIIPLSLTTSVLSSAGAVAGNSAAIAKGAIHMLTLAKLKIVALTTTAAVVIATPAAVVIQQTLAEPPPATTQTPLPATPTRQQPTYRLIGATTVERNGRYLVPNPPISPRQAITQLSASTS